MYKIELYYGYEDGESGIFHAFCATDPDIIDDDLKMGKRLAETLDLDVNDKNFNWDSMYITLPDSLVQKIKKDAVDEFFG